MVIRIVVMIMIMVIRIVVIITVVIRKVVMIMIRGADDKTIRAGEP